MKPHERQKELLSWLRSNDVVTAEDAADRLGVSLRTLHRDIASLRLEGYTIHGEPGRGGGIRLDPDAPPPPIEFDTDEVIGLCLTMKFVMASSTIPLSPSARSAVDKLMASLTLARQQEVRKPVPGAVAETVSRVAPEVLPRFEEAFRRTRGLRFDYADPSDGGTRTVEPHGVLIRNPVWYLLAIDVEEGDPRIFRLDRITKPRVIGSIEFDPRPLDDFEVDFTATR